MIRTFSFLFLFLSLVSCGKGGGGGSSSTVGTDQTISDEMLSPAETIDVVAPVESQTFEVNADLTGFSAGQKEKVYDAIELIKRIVASDSFKKRVLNHTYKNKKQYVDNGGLSNSQIYNKILAASEKLTPGKNNTMDVNLETYYTSANVIGYTKPSIKTIFMNRRYLSNFEAYQVASNMFHEWLHKLGFKHDYEATPSRPFSVPYAIGYIIKDLAQKLD